MAPEHKAYPASDYKKPYEHVSELVCFKNQQQWPVRKSRFRKIRKIQKIQKNIKKIRKKKQKKI